MLSRVVRHAQIARQVVWMRMRTRRQFALHVQLGDTPLKALVTVLPAPLDLLTLTPIRHRLVTSAASAHTHLQTLLHAPSVLWVIVTKTKIQRPLAVDVRWVVLQTQFCIVVLRVHPASLMQIWTQQHHVSLVNRVFSLLHRPLDVSSALPVSLMRTMTHQLHALLAMPASIQ